ncbi:tyrosine-type recombinase/integrase [Pseudorhodoplanes sp.]|uniref:tyrosine-type recombinase/integrase n=1 Tax=Pseudorhodoplanes sp. TaxID=1934341 RepID=UPI003D11896C
MTVYQGADRASLYSARGQRKYLTPEERARFIASATTYPRRDVGALCLTLAYTGCRISEALALTPEHIESTSGFIAVRSLKKRNRALVVREIPVPANVLAAIAPHLGKPEDPIWGYSRSRAWQLIKHVMQLAEIRAGIHMTPKGLRHGFGIHAVRSGIPLNLVKRWLGHARLETTAIYLEAMGPEERQIAQRMWN